MASDYVKRLRDRIGHDLLLLPSVAVLPRDDEGRLLLVRQTDSDQWGTIGGMIEIDESPAAAATREALKEAAIGVELVRLLGSLGGPEFRIRYPNRDEVAYVSIVYEARVTSGTPRPDGVETLDVGWFAPTELQQLDLNAFNRELLRATGFPVS